MAALASATVMSASACTRIPELAATVTDDLRDSDYPAFAPLEDAIVPLPPPQEQASQLEKDLTSRGNGLKSRARTLLTETSGDETAG